MKESDAIIKSLTVSTEWSEVPVGRQAPELPLIQESRYQIGAERARGGVGLVFEATDRLLGRRVAIKQPQRERPDASRFLREALITARLQHPAIVPIYDVGVRASGEPCYAMRLVPGATLRDAIGAARDLDERLALLLHVQAVADAVAYAHEQGIVHRDLKPSNVLVGPFGETVVIDWGLAKDLRGDDPDAPRDALAVDGDGVVEYTRTGAVLGTPSYMPPEQARGEEVDERADVYAIGAILYQLLCGDPPYREAPLQGVLAGPPPDVQSREPGVPSDLAAIVAKAMARDRSARYPTAQALALDLKRFATGQLVGARRYTTWELARRWLRRNRATASVAGVLAVALVLGAAAIVRARHRVAEENNRLRFMQAQALLERDPTAAAAWLKAHRVEPGSEGRAVDVAARAGAAGVARHVLTVPGDAAFRVCLDDSGRHAGVVGREGTMWLFDLDRAERRRLGDLGGPPGGCFFSRDRGHLITWASRDGGTVSVRLRDGQMTKLPVPADGTWPVRLVADGRLIVTSRDEQIHLVDLDGSRPPVKLHKPVGVGQTVLTADGTSVFGADNEGGLWSIPMDGGAATRIQKLDSAIYRISPTADGRQIAFGSTQDIGLRDTLTGRTRWRRVRPSPGDPINVIPANGGAIFLSGEAHGDAKVKWWNPSTDEEITLGSKAFFKTLAVANDGRRAAWMDTGGTIFVADLPGRLVRTLVGHHTALRGFFMTPDGAWLATTHGRTARVFALPPTTAQRIDLGSRMPRVAVVPGRAQVAATVGGQTLVSIDARQGTRRVLGDLGEQIEQLAISPEGRRAAVCGLGGRVLSVDLATGARQELERTKAPCSMLAFLGEQTLAGTDRSSTLHLWGLAAGTHRAVPGVAPLPFGFRKTVLAGDATRLLAVAPDGGGIVVGEAPGPLTTLGKVSGMFFRAALSRDGGLAAGGFGDGRVLVWDVARDPARPRQLARRPGFVAGMFFGADGRELTVADETGALARIDLASGATTEIGQHPARIVDARPSPSGRRVATVDNLGEIRIWEPATGALAVLHAQGEVYSLDFVDEDQLVSVAVDGWMQLMPIAPGGLVPASPPALARWLETLTTAHIDAAGEPVSL
jgi:WD40 repeat protein